MIGESSICPEISVIVPVYNAENTIRVCVDSILNQSYQDFELVLVDDGSQDGSLQICNDYMKKDHRIRVCQIEHGGVSAARNYGIDQARGTYLSFVDADDYLGREYLMLLADMIHNYPVGIAVIKESIVVAGKEPVTHGTDVRKSVELLDKEQALREVLIGQDKFGVAVWGKIYHRKLWDQIRFPVGVIYEDLIAIPRVFAQNEQVAYHPAVQYYYVMNSGSITHHSISEKDWDIIRNVKQLTDYIDEEFPQLHDAAVARMVKDHICYLYRLVDSKDYRHICTELKKDYQAYWREALKNRYVPLRHKMQMLLLLINPALYKAARKIANWLKP